MARCDRPDCGRGKIDEQGFCEVCDRRPLGGGADSGRRGSAEKGAGKEASEGASGAGPASGTGTRSRGASAAPWTANGSPESGGTAGDTSAGAAAAATGGLGGASVGVAQVRPDPWWGLGLVETGDGPPEPAEAEGEQGPEVKGAEVKGPAADEPVPEDHRFCGNPECGRPVGRGRADAPGRTVGFCPACGTAFDFTRPPAGHTIADRYEVRRVLGAGTYGAAYLAHDRNLETQVVLKALKRESAAQTAKDERNALVALRHDAIVRILSYEPEGPHLVLEYVPGAPLSARSGDRLEGLLAHGVRILQALDYLHARGLLHCDVKPSNIIRFREETPLGPRDRVRLIDFGSVRTMGDERPVVAYTEAYAPPKEDGRPPDPEHLRPTAGFDLFCLGRTLAEVCRPRMRDRTAPGVDSLYLLLDRAVAPYAPERRFVTARQFAEQLSGVIRQIVAAGPEGRRVAHASALFGSMPEALHGGLGEVRPFAHWVTAAQSSGDGLLTLPAPFAVPPPQDIAVALPTPLTDPDEGPVAARAEAALAECRLALRRRDPDLADRALASAALPPAHWLHSWYAGLTALARADVATATERFTEVRQALPGELIPQLALGLCAELRDDLPVAQSHYATVFGTTPALGSAGFGLARVHLRAGRRAQAVATARRLAGEFRFEREARVAAVRLLVAVGATVPPQAEPAAGVRTEGSGSGSGSAGVRTGATRMTSAAGTRTGGSGTASARTTSAPGVRTEGAGTSSAATATPSATSATTAPVPPAGPAGPAAPTADDLDRAAEAVAGLGLDAAGAAGLQAEIRYARGLLAGDRLLLSDVVRDVAPLAPTAREYTALVDLANRLRPPLPWRGLGRRLRRSIRTDRVPHGA
ncbi:tetratricopeptide repeat protein [Actinacidiphila acididurans]|uniref:non-specific serine/threonine protein kinase n=1 Tax=Actinacidiphila acididurans TaxID=2784346 RepID=A0ABS2TSX8_9ACTN|nr:tetratricopeptide repeat protein [Actinacidiphila acididurans]MBM9505927.1 protein kinase [Actinacidiphila acididurans]